jgi:hypothetical protein
MPAMDSVSEREFLDIYGRLHFSTAGIRSPREFNNRMIEEIERIRRAQEETMSERRSKNLQKGITYLKNLVNSGFAIRVFEEAYSNPNGFIALSLKYGKKEARRIRSRRFL